MSLPKKIVYGVLAFVCLVLGVIGMLVPVIPGVLFLAAGILLLGKVSLRVRTWSDKSPMMRSISTRLAGIKTVEPVDRAKAGGLMMVNLMAATVAAIASLSRRVISNIARLFASKP